MCLIQNLKAVAIGVVTTITLLLAEAHPSHTLPLMCCTTPQFCCVLMYFNKKTAGVISTSAVQKEIARIHTLFLYHLLPRPPRQIQLYCWIEREEQRVNLLLHCWACLVLSLKVTVCCGGVAHNGTSWVVLRVLGTGITRVLYSSSRAYLYGTL
jgi:hypothetical protein